MQENSNIPPQGNEHGDTPSNDNDNVPNSNISNNSEPISNANNNTDSNTSLDLGKFKDVKALKESYENLEKEHYRKLNEFHQLKEKLDSLETPKLSLSDTINKHLEEKGFIDYEELVKSGYTSEVINIVKSNIETEKALQTQKQQQNELKVNSILGSNKNEVLAFGNDFFSSAMFDEVEQSTIENISKENPTLYAKIANLLYESKQSVGTNTIVNPYTSPTKAELQFKSEVEFRDAMRDPKFNTDKNYRASVMARARGLR